MKYYVLTEVYNNCVKIKRVTKEYLLDVGLESGGEKHDTYVNGFDSKKDCDRYLQNYISGGAKEWISIENFGSPKKVKYIIPRTSLIKTCMGFVYRMVAYLTKNINYTQNKRRC